MEMNKELREMLKKSINRLIDNIPSKVKLLNIELVENKILIAYIPIPLGEK